MKKIWQFVIAGLMLLVPAVAQAQDSYVSLRVEPGVAVPVGNPQDDRFSVGGSVAIKPEISIFDIFSFGPSASVTAFKSEIEGVDSPSIWTVGGFVRVKRPHGFAWNSSEGAATVSPWVDADAQYARTGPLDRFGYAVGVGASWPVDVNRVLWIGPFARYQGVHQADGLVGRNTNDSHTLIFGASFEIGEPQEKPVAKAPVPAPVPQPETPKTPAPTPPATQEVAMHLKQVVQFAWDSDKLDSTAVQQLDAVLQKISSAKEFKAIQIEGHASSEGQVPHNDKLAQRRANSVLEYLAAHGVSRDKLSAVGFGSRTPVATNATESGRVLNRRAEFEVDFVIVQEVKK
jgi:outer membrane protein OmpA-like peptidoglycan-associated protein